MEMTPAAELRSLMIYLCIDSLSGQNQGGLSSFFGEEELEDILQLHWHLRDHVVTDIIRAAAAGHRLAKEEEAAKKT